jgi:hypothetical protein
VASKRGLTAVGVWKGETIVPRIPPVPLKQAVGPVGQDAVGGCGRPVEKAPFAWYINQLHCKIVKTSAERLPSS